MQLLTTHEILKADPKAFEKVENRIRAEEKEREWKAKRRGNITGSTAYKLFTKSLQPSASQTAQTYINEKVAEKFGSYSADWSSAATRWGNENEPKAVMAYMTRTGKTVTKWGDGIEHGDGQEFTEWIEGVGLTLDGLVDNNGTIEVKCPYNPANHIKYCLYESPEQLAAGNHDHYVQMQMGLLITNRSYCDFVSFDPRIKDEKMRLNILTVPRDEDFISILEVVLKTKAKEIRTKYYQLKNKYA